MYYKKLCYHLIKFTTSTIFYLLLLLFLVGSDLESGIERTMQYKKNRKKKFLMIITFCVKKEQIQIKYVRIGSSYSLATTRKK